MASYSSVDDQLLKSSVIALQTQFKLMVKEMRVMGEHIDKLTSDNEKLVNVSNTLASDNRQLVSDNRQLASDVKALQAHNDKQDSELRNLKKERPTSESGRTNVLRYVESHNMVLNK